ncbi:MAG: hypothetical protein WD042_17095 [Phycisphaeraceae bacterium]
MSRNKARDGGASIHFHIFDSDYGKGAQQHHDNFITPADRGRWMQLVYRLKASSDANTGDGAIEMWRRWEDEPNFTRIHSATDIKGMVPRGAVPGWQHGYMFGQDSDTFKEPTEWLLDRVEISTQPLVPLP